MNTNSLFDHPVNTESRKILQGRISTHGLVFVQSLGEFRFCKFTSSSSFTQCLCSGHPEVFNEFKNFTLYTVNQQTNIYFYCSFKIFYKNVINVNSCTFSQSLHVQIVVPQILSGKTIDVGPFKLFTTGPKYRGYTIFPANFKKFNPYWVSAQVGRFLNM